MTSQDTTNHTIGVIGARGHTGSELIQLLAGHGGFELVCVSSRELAGQPVNDHIAGVDLPINFENLSPEAAAQYRADAYVLALPNGLSKPFVEAIDRARPDSVIVDLSGDHRFDTAWQYGLPERFRSELQHAKRIANPGCYATGMQLGLLPVIELLDKAPHVFGVSGYSGAGTTPSPKNDLEQLRDNLMPYALTGHMHEREVSFQLGAGVHFMPHVAPFFRGITLTLSMTFETPISSRELCDHYRDFYAGEPLVKVTEDIPLVRANAGEHHVVIGGFAADGLSGAGQGRRHVAIVTLDNLLKGAATQALQNLNLACGFDEQKGIS